MSTKPVLYAGLPLPLADLSPEAFQEFVHKALVAIGPGLNLEVEALAGAGGDDGFDSWARRLSDGALVCLQAKRFKSSLNLDDVGHELAKVALTSHRDGSQVKEHWFVTSGSVARTVARPVRAMSHHEFRDAAIKQLGNPKLAALVGEIVSGGGSPADIVSAYVSALEKVQAWSGQDFNTRVSSVWSTLRDSIETTFVVHPLLLEKPRPDFDESSYLESLRQAARPSVSLVIVPTRSPSNLRARSAANPATEAQRDSTRPLGYYVERLLEQSEANCRVLVGVGGAGKSTTLSRLGAAAATKRAADASAPLPIVLSLSRYRTDLDDMIHRCLGITYGHWRSLPGPFLLFLDGLSEVSASVASAVASDLTDIAGTNVTVSSVISMRGSGLAQPVVLPVPYTCYRLAGLGIAQIQQIAALALPEESVASFMDAVLKRTTHASGSQLFALPFVVRYAAELFREHGELPHTLGELLERVLKRRFERNQELEPHQTAKPVALSTLTHLAGALAFHMRVSLGRGALRREELEDAVRRIKAEGKNVFGLDELADSEVIGVLIRHEYLSVSDDTFTFQHDLLAGFLAAHRLAAGWRPQVETLRTHSADDAWRFVGRYIVDDERIELIDTVAAEDPYLAAQMAVEMGPNEAIVARFLALENSWSTSELRSWIWMCALAVLNTDAVRTALRRIRDSVTRGSLRHVQATRALVMAGDEEVLGDVQRLADQQYRPGISGGDIAIWEDDAPALMALSLARSKLASTRPTDRIGASIKTVERFGGQQDGASLEVVLRQTSDSDAFLYAARALRKLDPVRAKRVLREAPVAADIWRRLHVLEMLASDGETIDTDWLLDVALADPKQVIAEFSFEPPDARAVQQRALRVLEAAVLTPENEARLVDAFESADLSRRQVAWQLATAHELELADELAVCAVEAAAAGGPIRDVAQACRFAVRRELPDELRTRFDTAVRLYTKDESELFEWDMVDALEYMTKRGMEADVAPRIRRVLELWVEAHDALSAGLVPKVARPKRGAFAGKPIDDTTLDFWFGWYRELFARHAEAIPATVRVKVMGLDPIDAGSHRAQRELLRNIPGSVLDEHLARLQTPQERTAAVVKLATYGPTVLRMSALREGIRDGVSLKSLLNAAKEMWDEDVAAAVVEGVVEIDWSRHEYPSIITDELMRNAPSFDRRSVARVIEPALSRQLTPNSREVLEAWRTFGLKRDPPIAGK